MDWTVIEGRWHEFRAVAKRRWDRLSEAYLLKRVQEAYALSADEAEHQRLAPAASS